MMACSAFVQLFWNDTDIGSCVNLEFTGRSLTETVTVHGSVPVLAVEIIRDSDCSITQTNKFSSEPSSETTLTVLVQQTTLNVHACDTFDRLHHKLGTAAYHVSVVHIWYSSLGL